MLSHKSIEERVSNGEIKVTYYFLPEAGDVSYHSNGLVVDLAEPHLPQTTYFRKRLFSDRLGLTLGPIIRSHNEPPFSGRPRFRGKRGYTDIRDTNGLIFLAPNETISVATNERISLGPSTAALILPRITLGDAGILLNVAYIDPYWDGTLQMVITNSTPRAQSLSLLEPIAQCFFFDLAQAADARFCQFFPAKSHHFGQTWHKVIDEQAEPFPLRKLSTVQPNRRAKVGAFIRSFWGEHGTKIKALGIIALVMVGVGGWMQFAALIRGLPEMRDQLATIAPYFDKRSDFNLPALKDSVDSLSERLPISGVETVVVPQGRTKGAVTVDINRQVSASSIIMVAPESHSRTISVSSDLISVNGKRAKYRISASLPNPENAPSTVEVKWVFIP